MTTTSSIVRIMTTTGTTAPAIAAVAAVAGVGGVGVPVVLEYMFNIMM